MIVLALNCGSTSVKFDALRSDPGAGGSERWRRLARGIVDRFGDRAELRFTPQAGAAVQAAEAVPDHTAAVRRVLAWLDEVGVRVDAVGHRVVHGGARFVRLTVVDDRVTVAIAELEVLAPLHNGPSLAGIRACREALGPSLPMVAVFDTAFHRHYPTTRPAMRSRRSWRVGTGSVATAFMASPTSRWWPDTVN